MLLSRTLLKVFFWIIVGIIPVVFLFINYKNSHAHDNGFKRQFKSEELIVDTIIDLRYPGYYFAGKKDATIYMGHLQAPAHIVAYNWKRTELQRLQFVITLDTLNPINWNAMSVNVDSPKVYFVYGLEGFVFQSTLSDSGKVKRTNLSSNSFDRFQALDSNYIIRKYQPEYEQNILALISEDSVIQESILPKQIDGVFCTDGMLLKNKASDLIYIFYYRNRFVKFNSELILDFEGKTIDTINRVQLELKTINDSSQVTYSKPPLRVNKKAFLSNQILYINSALKADNETFVEFNRNSVIDAYQLSDASYLYSFYIPSYYGKRGNDFEILQNQIFVLYNELMIIYKFNQ